MTWFKKSIAYDQKRKLLVLSLLMMLGIIYSIMDSISSASNKDILYRGIYSYTVALPITTYTSIIFMTILMAIISVGIRDKNETAYITSMPMKNYHVILTKFTCVTTSVLIPLVIGFIINSIAFVINKNVLVELGFIYKDIVYKYIGIALVALIIIAFIYLIGLMYNNIKVPTVLCILVGASVLCIVPIFIGCFIYEGSVRICISKFLESISALATFPIDTSAAYYPDTLGKIIVLAGIAVLLFTVVDYIAFKFENDIYDNVFSFKVSRIMSSIILTLTMIAIVSFVAYQLGNMLYLQPLSRSLEGEYNPDIYSNAALLTNRLSLGFGVILTPLWIFISKKINKKLEERF